MLRCAICGLVSLLIVALQANAGNSASEPALTASGLQATVFHNAMGLGTPLCKVSSPLTDGIFLKAEADKDLPCQG